MQVNIAGMSVAIGMPLYGGMMPRQTALSLAKTASFCATHGVVLDIVIESGPLPFARDYVLDEFLSQTAQKLFWIDGDMEWSPQQFAAMLALSQQVGVVCAAYPMRSDTVRYSVTYPENPQNGPHGLVEVAGCGLGFTIIDRAVAQALADTKPLVRDPMIDRKLKSVFRFDAPDGVMRTEDFAFFADLRELGHTVWLCPYIELGHVGQKVWHGSATQIKEKA